MASQQDNKRHAVCTFRVLGNSTASITSRWDKIQPALYSLYGTIPCEYLASWFRDTHIPFYTPFYRR